MGGGNETGFEIITPSDVASSVCSPFLNWACSPGDTLSAEVVIKMVSIGYPSKVRLKELPQDLSIKKINKEIEIMGKTGT